MSNNFNFSHLAIHQYKWNELTNYIDTRKHDPLHILKIDMFYTYEY